MAPISINGSGTVTGISAGGLPDASIVTADIADANITAAKLSGAQTGSAPIYGCRAWVNFDGSRNEADTGASTNGANVKIRASGNVTSVLKISPGEYTVTFTTAMVDINYCPVIAATSNYGFRPSASLPIFTTQSWTETAPTTSTMRFVVADDQASPFDAKYTTVAIFR